MPFRGRPRSWFNSGLWAVLLPYAAFIAHALLFGPWIMDDAGISFVYARNLAGGYGLVGQPGAIPVEGFSNFAWVISLTPFFLVHLFDPVLTPKLVGAACVLVTFILVQRAFRLFFPRPNVGTALVLGGAALNTSFVVWSISGMENPLYVLLIVLVWHAVMRWACNPDCQESALRWMALFAALAAITRPDGLVYAAAGPLFLLLTRQAQTSTASWVRSLVRYAVIFGAVYGSFLFFRIFYFGDIVPNTYYAKGGPSLLRLLAVWKANDLLLGALPLWGGLVGVVMLVMTIRLIRRKSLSRAQLAIALMVAIPLICFLIMPNEPSEFRFGTAFFIPYYAYIVVMAATLPAMAVNLHWGPRLRFLLPVLAVLGLASLAQFGQRTVEFRTDPPVPFARVAQLFGERFNHLALELGNRNASVLLPDVGGTLYCSDLTVVDLGGLTDRVVAQTLGKRQSEFYDYIFDKVRPTFIHTHGAWAYRSNLDGDSRFRADYVPIHERIDPWIRAVYGVDMYSGDYVRKDEANDHLEHLRAILESY